MMEDNITYLSEIKKALSKLGGMGSLKEITDCIQKRNSLKYMATNKNWKDNVRAVIQRHCNMTRSYNGAENIFYSVYGLGEGYWGLIKKKEQNERKDINPIIKRQITLVRQDKHINRTQKNMIISARIGQGVFREKLIEKYKCCMITGIKNPNLLVAGHIKPWRSSDNHERLSVENGLLLSPLYDKLFDSGLITFDEKMKLIVSPALDEDDQRKIKLSGVQLDIDASSEFKTNMEYHRKVIFKKA